MAIAPTLFSLTIQQEQVRPKTVRAHFAFLDGIRGVLALAVVFSHSTNLTTGMAVPAPDWMRLLQALGAFGVPGFIFLSGFCLGLPTIKLGFKLSSFPNFLRRRAYRIFPAYYMALVCAVIVATYFTHTFPKNWLTAPNPNITGPLLLIQDAYGSAPYDGPLWSMAPELHIYLCFPLILWLFRNWEAGKAAIAWVIVGCIAQHFAEIWGCRSLSFYLYGIFAVGVYAAWHLVSGLMLPSVDNLKKMSAGACFLFAALTLEVGYRHFWDMLPVLSVLECLVLLPVFGLLFQHPLGSLRKFLESPLMQFLGKVSYSLYLTHWIVLSLILMLFPASWPVYLRCAVGLLFGIPASVLFAALFYRLFEHPYLSERRNITNRDIPSINPAIAP